MAGSGSTVLSLPPPLPKSPPAYPDLYGKRRELARVQMLEREIGLLEEELKSIEGIQPASRCCKEVADFVGGNSDPLIPTNQKNRKACRFWKWLCGMSCFNFSWICCYTGCSCHLEMPHCCDCNICSCPSCVRCSLPKCVGCSLPKCPKWPKWWCCAWRRWQCCSWPMWRCCCWPCSCCCSCFRKVFYSRCFCILPCPSCPDCPSNCCRWTCSCPKCPKILPCCSHSSCTEGCCNPCCLC